MLRVSNDMPVSNYSVVVPAENGVSFTENNVIRFRVPQTLGFIDPYTSCIKFDLTLLNNTIKGKLVGSGGANSVIRMVRIMADGHVIEEIDNWNGLADLHANYGYDLGELQLRDVMEGGSGNSEFADGLNNPTALAATAVDNKNVKVCLPMNLSGVLGSRQALPLVAMGDLEIELTLEENERAVSGIQRQWLSRTPVTESLPDGVATTTLNLLANLQGGTAFGVTPARNDEYQTNWEQSVTAAAVGDDNPWIVGQHFKLLRADGTDTALEVASQDVAITAVSYNGAAVRLTFAATTFQNSGGALTESFRVEIITGVGNAALACAYQVNVPEYVCRVVVPPADYMADLQSQIVNEGYAFDVHTWTTYRTHSVSRAAGAGSADTIEVPCYGSRAKAVLLRPVDATNPKNLADASAAISAGGAWKWNGEYDHTKDYQFQIGEIRVPTRRVNCTSLDYPQGFPAQEQQTELDKALRACGIGVHNLRKNKSDFVIARALSAYGGTTDLRMKGLRCYVDGSARNPSSGANQAIKEKNWYNYVSHIKRVVITPAGLEVLY